MGLVILSRSYPDVRYFKAVQPGDCNSKFVHDRSGYIDTKYSLSKLRRHFNIFLSRHYFFFNETHCIFSIHTWFIIISLLIRFSKIST